LTGITAEDDRKISGDIKEVRKISGDVTNEMKKAHLDKTSLLV